MKAFNVNIGHARGVYPAAAGHACGRYAPKSGPDGIRRPADGKPYCTGKEN